MDTIFEKGKEFEYLVTTFDPLYKDLAIAIDLVKQFIIDHNLLSYGGTAIDYCLRLKGDKIYPDGLLKVPDLDFFSSDSVEHAYMLADILFNHGYTEARAINALHIETMHVDLADNHFIADISYRPPEVFNKIPYLVYNGMRIIHPDFQRIDMHSALSFPYDNSPREVIYERWAKDIKRFNKLAEHYPITLAPGSATVPTRPVTVTELLPGTVLTGFAAYAMIYTKFRELMTGREADIADTIVPAEMQASVAGLTFDTLDQVCEIVHFDIKKAARDFDIVPYRRYEPYINLLPERIEGARGIGAHAFTLILYSTQNRLVSVNSVVMVGPPKITYRITNIQFLLKYFLSMYFMLGGGPSAGEQRNQPKKAATYLARYISLLEMINAVENLGSPADDPVRRLFFPSVSTYGNDNINLAREITLNRLYNDLYGKTLYKVPLNYYPARSKARGIGHPVFVPRELEFFREEGREIVENGAAPTSVHEVSSPPGETDESIEVPDESSAPNQSSKTNHSSEITK